MPNERVQYLLAEIANYRDQIALAAEPGTRATFAAFLDLAERELALHLAKSDAGADSSLAR